MSQNSIMLGPEPPELLLTKSAVFAWLPGMSEDRWRKIQHTLTPMTFFGGTRPFYRKSEIKIKLIDPIITPPRG
jgi:hypothetical protein